MSERRMKGIKQGLPGVCDLTDLRDFTDGDMVQWSSSLYKWEVKAAADTIDLTANYVWTGTHEFDAQVDFDADVDFNSTTSFAGAMTVQDDITIEDKALFIENASGQQSVEISDSVIELGNQSAAGFAVFDMHTSGNGNDYDSRILGITGTGHATLSGYGDMRMDFGELTFLMPGSGASDWVFTSDGAGNNDCTFDDCTFTVFAPPANLSSQFVGRGTATGSGTTTYNTVWYNSTPTAKALVTEDGEFIGKAYTVSDERSKRAIIDETNGKDVLKQIRAVNFIYNDDETNTRRSGFLAQQLRELIPEAVKLMPGIAEHKVGHKIAAATPDRYAIDPLALMPTMVNAIKEMDDDLTQAKVHIRALKDRLDALEGV